MLSDLIYLLTTENLTDNVFYSQELIKKVLTSFLQVSESEYVFLNEITDNKFNDPCLSTIFLTSIDFNKQDGYGFKLMNQKEFVFRCLERYYSTIVVDQVPLIENNLENSDNGHYKNCFTNEINLRNFLVLPIFFEPTKKLVGLIGLINRRNGFDEQIIFKLHPFCLNLSNYMYLNRYIKKLRTNKILLEEE